MGKTKQKRGRTECLLRQTPLRKALDIQRQSFQLLGHVSSHAGQMMVLDITQKFFQRSFLFPQNLFLSLKATANKPPQLQICIQIECRDIWLKARTV